MKFKEFIYKKLIIFEINYNTYIFFKKFQINNIRKFSLNLGPLN